MKTKKNESLVNHTKDINILKEQKFTPFIIKKGSFKICILLIIFGLT